MIAICPFPFRSIRQIAAKPVLSICRVDMYLGKFTIKDEDRESVQCCPCERPSPRFALSRLCATADARADDPYYKGKRLTLLIGSAAGGPTDIEGRLFAKYLGRHIDGQPSVIVQNKDGAGGLLAPTYLGEVAPKDGTMLGYFSGTAWNYVNNPEHWRVDLKTFEFVAYQSGTTIHFVRTDVPPGMKKPTDIVKARIWSSAASASTTRRTSACGWRSTCSACRIATSPAIAPACRRGSRCSAARSICSRNRRRAIAP